MTREEHHAKALEWLAVAERDSSADLPKLSARAVAIAQVHATLALYEPPVRVEMKPPPDVSWVGTAPGSGSVKR